jgi:hypothetical protein
MPFGVLYGFAETGPNHFENEWRGRRDSLQQLFAADVPILQEAKAEYAKLY